MATFRPIYRRVLKESYREGRLSKKDYDVLLDAYKRPLRYNEKGEHVNLMVEVEKCAHKHLKKRAIDLAAIWKWIKENWVLILKLLFSLLPLFLMVEPKQPQN
jgi:hypothetical protein